MKHKEVREFSLTFNSLISEELIHSVTTAVKIMRTKECLLLNVDQRTQD